MRLLLILLKARITAAVLAFTSILVGSCGTSSCPKPDYPQAYSSCNGQLCQTLKPAPKANPIQCATSDDCGAPPHTQDMMCIQAGYCLTVCKEHWGDCNNDYRDGCETPINHRYYCDGDPRINEVSEPSVTIYTSDEGNGPGRFPSKVFRLAIDEQRPRLEKCYDALLNITPTLGGVMVYQFTLGESGKIIRANLVENEPRSKELETCVANLVANVCFAHGPKGGPITYSYDFVFVPKIVAGQD